MPSGAVLISPRDHSPASQTSDRPVQLATRFEQIRKDVLTENVRNAWRVVCATCSVREALIANRGCKQRLRTEVARCVCGDFVSLLSRM